MPGIKTDGGNIVSSLKELGFAATDSVLDFFKSDKDAAAAVARRSADRSVAAYDASVAAMARQRAAGVVVASETKGFWATIGRGIGKTVYGVGYAGAKLVDIPLGIFVLKPVNWLVKGGAAAFTHFRRGAPLLAIGGAAAYVANRYSHKQAEMLEQNFAAAQQDMAMQAMAAQPAYGLQPGEFTQNVAPLMREGNQNDGHTDRLAAARAASAQAPKTADISAL